MGELLPLPCSRGCLLSLAHGLFLCLQRHQCRTFSPLWLLHLFLHLPTLTLTCLSSSCRTLLSRWRLIQDSLLISKSLISPASPLSPCTSFTGPGGWDLDIFGKLLFSLLYLPSLKHTCFNENKDN